jgi:hypothetical protein
MDLLCSSGPSLSVYQIIPSLIEEWFLSLIVTDFFFHSFSFYSGYGPPIQAFLYQIPIIGWILQYPFQVSLYFTEELLKVKIFSSILKILTAFSDRVALNNQFL